MTENNNPLSSWPHLDRAQGAGSNGSRTSSGAPQGEAPEPANALEAFLGGSPAAVALKLFLMSLVVGALMMWLEIRPADILVGVVNFLRRIYALGFGAVRELIEYVLAGAAIVLPVWLLLRVLNASGRK
ncbi:MAG TPA: DUF6460 domain-containing protein [Methylocystis sp.]|nr:DUF6460 domain-containing protein [Methylocystis sp.]